MQPSADVDSPRVRARQAKRLGIADPDSYETQATDWSEPRVPLHRQGQGSERRRRIRDNVRKISQGSGVKVYSAVDGLKPSPQGKEINYEGASGPCDFTRHRRHRRLQVPLQQGSAAASSCS